MFNPCCHISRVLDWVMTICADNQHCHPISSFLKTYTWQCQDLFYIFKSNTTKIFIIHISDSKMGKAKGITYVSVLTCDTYLSKHIKSKRTKQIFWYKFATLSIVKIYLIDTINVCQPCFGRWPCQCNFFDCLITTQSISVMRESFDTS